MAPRSKTPWEAEFWVPEPIWCGETAFLLAGGPSLADIDLTLLRGRPTLTINSSALAALQAGIDDGVLFFMDNGWWHNHRAICSAWRGPIMTLSRAAKREAPQLVRRLDMASPAPHFPPIGAPVIRWGRSSGHIAISLTVALGAARIVLLGYDMRVVDGQSHHHADYDRPAHPGVYAEFLKHFEGWRDAAAMNGVEIVNATPGSTLTEFPTADLADMLQCPALL